MSTLLGAEHVEVEVIGLLEEVELLGGLRGEDVARAAAEAAVVDSGDATVMVGQFLMNLGLGNGVHVMRELGFLGGAVSVGGVVVFRRR